MDQPLGRSGPASGTAELALSGPALPALPASGRAERLLWTVGVIAAFLLLAAVAARVAALPAAWGWWTPLVFVAGMAAADLASGLVHWSADTWGRDDLPVIGPRLLVPFRVHHVNPDDFLRRRFVDANGEVAILAIAPFAALLLVPLDAAWGPPLAVFGLAFCGVGMLTNQIHQWAHMPSPPRLVAWLQASGLILGRRGHAIHHQQPYEGQYCITTGWCNRPLEAVAFFRRLERLVTRLTGAEPRGDDRRYEERCGTRATCHGTRATGYGTRATGHETRATRHGTRAGLP